MNGSVAELSDLVRERRFPDLPSPDDEDHWKFLQQAADVLQVLRSIDHSPLIVP